MKIINNNNIKYYQNCISNALSYCILSKVLYFCHGITSLMRYCWHCKQIIKPCPTLCLTFHCYHHLVSNCGFPFFSEVYRFILLVSFPLCALTQVLVVPAVLSVSLYLRGRWAKSVCCVIHSSNNRNSLPREKRRIYNVESFVWTCPMCNYAGSFVSPGR